MTYLPPSQSALTLGHTIPRVTADAFGARLNSVIQASALEAPLFPPVPLMPTLLTNPEVVLVVNSTPVTPTLKPCVLSQSHL